MAKRTPDIVILGAAVVLLIIAIHSLFTVLTDKSSETIPIDKKKLDDLIEKYVNDCMIAKTIKDVNGCTKHLFDIQTQCKTNLNYSGVVACNDPRLDQMIK